ncbi:ATP-binding protein [Ramlibacter sp. WS9]|uniref:ATP-binding protein n=1 Tax=Ramlibacter sp. WS9 TaxID=1882741 RepID=UPI0013054326|nr:ATP-binding protein [Ramlibacter sp. WS9]
MAHILVVDDRPLNRQLLVTLLGYYEHRVSEAGDGLAAMEQIATDRPDLVITDLLMPNMDGEQLCVWLRGNEATAAIPIIIHTASYRARQARQTADRVRVRWVLPKPSDPAEIMAMVNEALGPLQTPVADPGEQMQRPAGRSAGPRRFDQLATVRERNDRLARLLADAAEIAHVQARALSTAELPRDAQSEVSRLTNLVNLGMEMSWERDPDAMVARFCEAAQEVIGARYVGVAVLAPDGALQEFASAGIDQATHDALKAVIGNCAAARHVLDPTQPRMLVAEKAGDFVGLPETHPPVRTFLACPLMSRNVVHGWMYAADRMGGEAFDAGDERIISALAAVLATAWSGLLVVGELDRRVAQRTRQLERVNEQLEAYSLLVSHDLRAPLGSIDGFAKALRDKAGAVLPPDGKRYLDKIDRNVEVMRRLIDDLLHFARTSHMEVRPRKLDLGVLVNDCLASFKDEIDRRGVTLELGALGECCADPPLLAQVMLNLLGNAIKYTRKEPHPVIHVACRTEADDLVISVKDNGAGFDMQFAEALFKPFGRLHSSSEFEGSGIGLALVEQVVRRHGGRVWAESSPGAGASVFFTLPLEPHVEP